VPSAVLTVTSALDDGSAGTLRSVIASAASGDTIVFSNRLPSNIITLDSLKGQLTIGKNLDIEGPGANKLTISGNNAIRVFDVNSGATVTIAGLTIANGLAPVVAGNALGGGLLNEGATVILSKDLFTSNEAVGPGAGGAAVANIGGSLTANQTDFLGNTALAAADNFAFGAVFNDDNATADIEYGAFSGNKTIGGNSNGGAIGEAGGSLLTLAHCTFDGNLSQGGAGTDTFTGGGFGGAIAAEGLGFFNFASPTIDISYCSFSGNKALVVTGSAGQDGGQGNGGAITLQDGALVTVSHSSFDGNLARGGNGGDGATGSDGGAGGASFGGAIGTASATLIVSNSRFSNNQAQGGNGGNGGAGGNGGDAGFGLGGALSSTALISTGTPGSVEISNCQFSGNQAVGGAGGAGGAGGNGGFGNRGDGGAIINLIGSMTISDTSITQNASQGGAGGAAGSGGVGGDGGLTRGGGFANERGGTATLTRVSIVNNTATGGAGAVGGNGGDALGGGVFNGRFQTATQPATLTLLNCTVTSNLATGGAGGTGGNGGNAFGGGVFNGNPGGGPVPTVTLEGTNVTANQAVGGAAGSGGAAGQGVGGGVYNKTGAVAFVDAFTTIHGNKASTSNDDVFGVLTPI
jgi:hypothetical protein